MATQWFYKRGENEFGPFTTAELRQRASSGELLLSDLIRKDGTEKHIPAHKANGLFPKEDAESTATEKRPVAAKKTETATRTTADPDSDAVAHKKERFSWIGTVLKGAKLSKSVSGVVVIVADVLSPIGPALAVLLGLSATSSGTLGILVKKKSRKKDYNPDRVFPEQVFIFALVLTVFSGIWFTITMMSGDKKRGIVASNVPAVAQLQDSLLKLEKGVADIKKDTTQIKEDTKNIKEDTKNIKDVTTATQKDVAQVKEDTKSVKKGVEQISTKTDAVKEDTTAIRDKTDAIHEDTAEIKKTTKGIDTKLTNIDEGIQRVGSAGDLIVNPKTKKQYLHNAEKYAERPDYKKARKAYQHYFELETGDFIDVYDAYWQLLDNFYDDEDRVATMFGALVEKHPDSLAAQLILLNYKESDEATDALKDLYRENPEFVPALAVIADRLPSSIIEDQLVIRLQEKYIKQGGYSAAKTYLLRPEDDKNDWVYILKDFAEPPGDINNALQIDFERTAYGSVLGIDVRDAELPRSLSLQFPDDTVVTVPFGAENPAGVDQSHILFELESGREGRYRFEKRAANDLRHSKHCGSLFGIGSKPINVVVSIVDSQGRDFTFPKPIVLVVPSFSATVVKPDAFKPQEGPSLEITAIEFLASCEVSLDEAGPYVPVYQDMDVPTIRAIRLADIRGLPLKAGQHELWVKGKTDRAGRELGPELINFEIPPGMTGLTGKPAKGRSAKPKSKSDNKISMNASAALCWSPNGKVLAGAGDNNKIALVSVDGTLLSTLENPFDPNVLQFSPDGKYLFAASTRENSKARDDEEIVRIVKWDVKQGKIAGQWKAQPHPTFTMAVSADGKLLASGHRNAGRKSYVRLWDTKTGKELAQLTGHQAQQITCLAFSPDGRLLAGSNGHSSGNGDVVVWDVARRTKKETLRGGSNGTHGLAFSPNGELLLIGSGKNPDSAKLWDVETGENLADSLPTKGRQHIVAYPSSDRPLLLDAVDARATVWNVKTGKELLSLRSRNGVSVAAFSPDGHTLATGGQSVSLWNIP